MENNFNPEQIARAKAAGSPDELLSLAKESGLDMTEEQANAYFEGLHKNGELSDDEIGNTTGGGCFSKPKPQVGTDSCNRWRCADCGADYFTAGDNHKCGMFVRERICLHCKYYGYDPKTLNTFCTHPDR